MKQVYDVTGMTCSACSSRVDKVVRKLEGVSEVNVNLLQNKMTVEYEAPADETAIIKAVVDAGYGASVHQERDSAPSSAPKSQPVDESEGMKKRLISSFCFLIPLMYVSMGSMFSLPQPAILQGHENMLKAIAGTPMYHSISSRFKRCSVLIENFKMALPKSQKPG